MHLGVKCIITFCIISENEQLHGIKLHNYTMFMLFNLMLTVKPCTKINRFRGCICNTVKDLSSILSHIRII